MAWGRRGRPFFKVCKGYGRKPHEMLYDKDFPVIKRKLKNGQIKKYAATLCKDCKNRYDRDRRRKRSKEQGRATRPQDVPWKRYQVDNEEMVERRGMRLVTVKDGRVTSIIRGAT